MQPEYIIIHHAYTPVNMDIGYDEIYEWHVTDNGWSDVGYHFIVRRNGRIEQGRPLNQPGAHTSGYNDNFGICLVGGKPGFNFTRKQMGSLAWLIEDIFWSTIEWEKALKVRGHNDFAQTECPGFNVKAWWYEGRKKLDSSLYK